MSLHHFSILSSYLVLWFLPRQDNWELCHSDIPQEMIGISLAPKYISALNKNMFMCPGVGPWPHSFSLYNMHHGVALHAIHSACPVKASSCTLSSQRQHMQVFCIYSCRLYVCCLEMPALTFLLSEEFPLR